MFCWIVDEDSLCTFGRLRRENHFTSVWSLYFVNNATEKSRSLHRAVTYDCRSCHSSYHAICIASSLPSFEAFESSSKTGSSTT